MAAAIFASFVFCWTFGGCHDGTRGGEMHNACESKIAGRG
jgi:hypothetical protein